MIVGTRLDARDHFIDDIVFDLLIVLRYIPFTDAVEIPPSDRERILVEIARDLVDHVLDAKHPLRPAEAAKCRV